MLRVKQFPADMSAFEVNRADMKQCFISGLFEETVKTGDESRKFYDQFLAKYSKREDGTLLYMGQPVEPRKPSDEPRKNPA